MESTQQARQQQGKAGDPKGQNFHVLVDLEGREHEGTFTVDKTTDSGLFVREQDRGEIYPWHSILRLEQPIGTAGGRR